METFDGRVIDTTTGPVGVALALLEQHWPSCPALEDSIDTRAPVGLERDPRYLIGRLQQALTVLLEQDSAAHGCPDRSAVSGPWRRLSLAHSRRSALCRL